MHVCMCYMQHLALQTSPGNSWNAAASGSQSSYNDQGMPSKHPPTNIKVVVAQGAFIRAGAESWPEPDCPLLLRSGISPRQHSCLTCIGSCTNSKPPMYSCTPCLHTRLRLYRASVACVLCAPKEPHLAHLMYSAVRRRCARGEVGCWSLHGNHTTASGYIMMRWTFVSFSARSAAPDQSDGWRKRCIWQSTVVCSSI